VDKAALPVDKAFRSWIRRQVTVYAILTPVGARDIDVASVPRIPQFLHRPPAGGSLVAMRSQRARRMVHTATATATYMIDRISTDGAYGGVA